MERHTPSLRATPLDPDSCSLDFKTRFAPAGKEQAEKDFL